LEVLEEPITRHDGVVRLFSTIKAPIYNDSGQVVMLVGVGRDITEAKRNEAVHKQAEEKIREQAALLNITADAILVRDLDNQILFWNAGAAQLYGWAADEAIGQYSHNLWTEVSSQQAEVLETVITHGYWQGELHKITKDQREITIQSRWTLMRDETNVPRSVLTVDTDITEQKRLESQFYRAQRLESIGTLASGIAHDLNNVLTPILAIAQLLPQKLQNLSQQDQNLLKMIEDSAKRGADLIKQILSFARGVEGNRSPLQIGSLLMDIRQVIQRTFPKSIELQGSSPVQPLWSVSADATQLHQVIMNLCVNARDAMPNGGTLTLSAHNVQLDEKAASLHLDAREGDYLVITIADTGWGIPPEHLDQIFDPFFTTKEPGKGTGLGLSTVLGIVKNHGGFVMVSSTLGQGSQFQVYLPAIVEQETEAVTTSDLPHGNQEVVLIVDDEAIIRDTLQTLLERHGYNTLVAQNGVEAIDLYTQYQHRIDVVLMDIRMPSMDGLTAIRSLQRLNSHLKVIAASGLTLDKQLIGRNKTPIKAFLQKPYSVEDLLKTLRVVLQPSN
ncbi:MAG TPA: ATP-binding protein, partial [Allocoleopsis sp.]